MLNTFYSPACSGTRPGPHAPPPLWAQKFLSRLLTSNATLPLAAFSPQRRPPNQPYFPLCLISPCPAACLFCLHRDARGKLSTISPPSPAHMESWVQSCWPVFFLPIPPAPESMELLCQFLYSGFSQKSAFSEELQPARTYSQSKENATELSTGLCR